MKLRSLHLFAMCCLTNLSTPGALVSAGVHTQMAQGHVIPRKVHLQPFLDIISPEHFISTELLKKLVGEQEGNLLLAFP